MSTLPQFPVVTPRRPSERLPEWVPVLLEPEDRKMLEDLKRLKGSDASRVIRALIIREHKLLDFMVKR